MIAKDGTLSEWLLGQKQQANQMVAIEQRDPFHACRVILFECDRL
jgi:hypothetical protein